MIKLEATFYPKVIDQVFALFMKRGSDKMDSMSTSIAQAVESYAKLNAPWQDRTGDARVGLKGSAVRNNSNELTVSIAHGVDYGIYLERSNSGRFAILGPTMRAMTPVIIEEYRKAWR